MKIAISMRVAKCDYGEIRDCIAEDWIPFLRSALPSSAWFAMPNCGEDALRFAQDIGANAIILSGGDNIGDLPQRDATEKALMDFALKQHIPVLGVCRGLQYICSFFGGRIKPLDASVHAGKRHGVDAVSNAAPLLGWTGMREVNSYHRLGVDGSCLPDCLEPLAASPDGIVEAVKHREFPILGVQWHPERQLPYDKEDISMTRGLFISP